MKKKNRTFRLASLALALFMVFSCVSSAPVVFAEEAVTSPANPEMQTEGEPLKEVVDTSNEGPDGEGDSENGQTGEQPGGQSEDTDDEDNPAGGQNGEQPSEQVKDPGEQVKDPGNGDISEDNQNGEQPEGQVKDPDDEDLTVSGQNGEKPNETIKDPNKEVDPEEEPEGKVDETAQNDTEVTEPGKRPMKMPQRVQKNENGVIEVSASDLGTGWGNYESVTIDNFVSVTDADTILLWTNGNGVDINKVEVAGDDNNFTAVTLTGSDDIWNGTNLHDLDKRRENNPVELKANLAGVTKIRISACTGVEGAILYINTKKSTASNDTGCKSVTVTGIAATGDWNATDSAYQNWFIVPDVQLDPNGTLTIKGNNQGGINISGIEINGVSKTVTQIKETEAITISGTTNGENGLEKKGDEYQIAWLDSGAVAAINLQKAGFNNLSNQAYNIKIIYAVETGTPGLIIESSVGEGNQTYAYTDISHGNITSGGEFAIGNCNSTPARVTMNGNGNSTKPGDKAIWFFDSHGETKSFNTTNDTYEDELKVNAKNKENKLILYASADGCIRQTGKEGEFWINWENQTRTNSPAVGSKDLMQEGYTDGSYTVVGWGGTFESSSAKTAIRFKLKDGGDGTLSDALNHLTVYLVDQDGTIIDKVWVQSNMGNGQGEDDLHYVGTTDDNYYIFEATLKGSDAIQGIKLAFDRNTTGESDNHHSGTLVVAEVEMKVNDAWKDFGPFNYYSEDNKYENPYNSPVKPGYRPFVRSSHFLTELKPGAKAGYNLATPQSGFNWHMWTMSTSDANIVNSNYSGNVDALQIKYSNTKLSSGDLHVTYTHLVGNKDITGEWLAITLGGEVDANTKFQLVNSSEPNSDAVVRTLNLTDFTTDKVLNSNNKVSADTFKDNEYHTIYYYLGGSSDVSFKSVYVDVSGTADTPGDATRYMYITEIYVLPTNAEIKKGVSKTDANPGDELTYTLTVENTGSEAITQFEVTDVLPEHVTYDTDKNTNKGISYNETTRTVTWTWIGTLSSGNTANVEIAVTVDNDCPAGSLDNTATITKLNNQQKQLNSNKVTTIIQKETPDEYVFYAEIGQKTMLHISLGQTVNTKEETTWTETLSEAGTLGTSGNSGASVDSKEVEINVPVDTSDETYELRLSCDTAGGFVFGSITIGDRVYNLNKAQSGISFTESTEKTGMTYHDNTGENNVYDKYEFQGGLSSFGKGYITLKDVPRGTNKAKIHLDQSYEDRSFTLTLIKKTKTNQTVVDGDPIPDTFTSIPAKTTVTIGNQQEDSATIEIEYDNNTAIDSNSADLYYTSNENVQYTAGTAYKDTFNITISQNGQTKTVPVIVYNYQVKDHVYVLDYGLPVKLGSWAIYNSGNPSDLLSDAVLQVNGAEDSAMFSGLYQDPQDNTQKRNKNGIADTADMAGEDEQDDYSDLPYGSSTLSLKNGTVEKCSGSSLDVIFTPGKFMSDVDTFYYGVQVGKNGTMPTDATNGTPVMEGKITVMPANVVYYEDNFKAVTGNGTQQEGTGTDAEQSNDKNGPYGNDNAYNNTNQDSGNSSTIICSNKIYSEDKLENVEGTDGKTDTVSFEFKGTGFEIIGRSTTSSPIVNVMYREKNTKEWNVLVVDTYYANGDLYQLPVISKTGLEYKTYEVKIGVTTSSKGNTFYLDGIRIYNPLGDSAIDEEDDPRTEYDPKEQNAKFTNIREMLLGNGDILEEIVTVPDEYGSLEEYVVDVRAEGRKAILVEYDEENLYLSGYNSTTAEQIGSDEPAYTDSMSSYLAKAPNYEVYLADGYGVAFIVSPEQNVTDKTIQVEAKKVNIAGYVDEDNETTQGILLQTLKKDDNGYYIPSPIKGVEVTSKTAMYYEIDLNNCISLGNGKYLVVLLGSEDYKSNTLAITNIKTKGYSVELPGYGGSNVIQLPAITKPDNAFDAVVESVTISNPKVKSYATVSVVLSDIKNKETADKIQVALYLDSATVADGTSLKPATIKSGNIERTYNSDKKTLTINYPGLVKMPTTAQSMKLTVIPQLVEDGNDPVNSINSFTKVFAVKK